MPGSTVQNPTVSRGTWGTGTGEDPESRGPENPDTWESQGRMLRPLLPVHGPPENVHESVLWSTRDRTRVDTGVYKVQ